MEFDELSNIVIGCAIAVHRALRPGLLESVYEQCLARELALSDIQFQVPADSNHLGLSKNEKSGEAQPASIAKPS